MLAVVDWDRDRDRDRDGVDQGLGVLGVEKGGGAGESVEIDDVQPRVELGKVSAVGPRPRWTKHLVSHKNLKSTIDR